MLTFFARQLLQAFVTIGLLLKNVASLPFELERQVPNIVLRNSHCCHAELRAHHLHLSPAFYIEPLQISSRMYG
jgi:hypothetical protein